LAVAVIAVMAAAGVGARGHAHHQHRRKQHGRLQHGTRPPLVSDITTREPAFGVATHFAPHSVHFLHALGVFPSPTKPRAAGVWSLEDLPEAGKPAAGCGEGLGVGVVRFFHGWRHRHLTAPPPSPTLPHKGGGSRPRSRDERRDLLRGTGGWNFCDYI